MVVPEGFPAAFLDADAGLAKANGKEGELLLPRGCILRIIGRSERPDDYGLNVFDCTIEAPKRDGE